MTRIMRAILVGLARDKGFKGIVATRGQHGPRPGPPVSADRHHAGHLPAGHAGLDGAEQPQTGPGHAAHPGADYFGGGRAPARPGARRFFLHRQTGDDRRAGAVLRSHQELRRPATIKRLLVVEDNEIERQSIVELLGHDDIEIVHRRHGQRRRCKRCSTGRLTAACSTCACRT